MQQGSSNTGTVTLTDEQILGLDDGLETMNLTSGAAAGQAAGAPPSATGAPPSVILSEAKDLSRFGEQGRDSSGRRTGPQSDGALVASDEDILNRPSGAPQSGAPSGDAANAAGPDETSLTGEARPIDRGGSNRGPQAGDFASDPAWLKTLESQPTAAAEARQWRDAARDISSIDAAYFSAEPGARAGLAERLYQSDPAAFRAMLVDSARMLAARDPRGLAELARQLGMPEAAQPLRPRSVSQAARQATESDLLTAKAPLAGDFRSTLTAEARLTGDFGSKAADVRSEPSAQISSAQTDSHPNMQPNDGSSGQRERAASAAREEQSQPGVSAAPQFPAEAYRAFEASTNDDVGRRMHEAIDRTLASTLPEGIAEGARRRIGEDIFREVHASLASDRELSRRVGETLRDWRFDAAARQQVVTLLTGRARAMLPEVARRVVAEWTSSVLASDRARVARIDAAAARHDITGGRLPEPVSSSTLRPREVDYRRLSDEQILEM